jgi:hypothetical protein
MLKSNVGWSTNKDSYIQGKETAAKAVVDLVQTKVAFLYTSVDSDVKKVLEGAKEELGTAPIIGCTSSAGIIVPDGFISSEDGFTGILALGDPELEVGVAGSAKEKSARETGRKVAIEAMRKAGKDCSPAYFYMVASPGEEEEYVKGIEDIIGRVPVFGGSAADNTVEGKWSIYTNDTIFNDGVAVAFFYTDKPMANVFTGEYHETTNSGVITKVEGKRTLVEIDGVPAIKKYAEWTGNKLKDLDGSNLLVTTITAPLGVKDRLGDLIAIRHPMYGNKDKSMNIGANLAVNTAIIQMEATVDELIDSTGKTMKEVNKEINDNAGAYLLVHCGGRRLGIGDRIDEVAAQLKKEAKGKPFIAVFTFGEYGVKDHGANTTGGLMLSFTAFGK